MNTIGFRRNEVLLGVQRSLHFYSGLSVRLCTRRECERYRSARLPAAISACVDTGARRFKPCVKQGLVNDEVRRELATIEADASEHRLALPSSSS
jgi:hypothetical protein